MNEAQKIKMQEIRANVRFLYDLQDLRISTRLREVDGAETEHIEDEDKTFMGKMSSGMKELETQALKEVARNLKSIPIYTEWLSEQKGCGPTMSGVIVATIDIHKAENVSKLWAYAGLDPTRKREKGVKLTYNPFLKTKMVKVLAESFIKANSPWRKFYDDYKNRKKQQLCQCMLCGGSGKYVAEPEVGEDGEIKTPAKKSAAGRSNAMQKLDQRILQCVGGVNTSANAIAAIIGDDYETHVIIKRILLLVKCGTLKTTDDGLAIGHGNPPARDLCTNCGGSGIGPWGKSDAHRDAAAKRYMIKMFLKELYVQWRTLEGLEVRKPYMEEYLGRVHHG